MVFFNYITTYFTQENIKPSISSVIHLHVQKIKQISIETHTHIHK